jgi:hypothetical protein
MPIDLEFLHAGAGVIFHCRGALALKDLFDANNHLLADAAAVKKWRYAIVDLTETDSLDINYQRGESVVDHNELLAAAAPQGVIIAIASPKDWTFGIARMWQTLAERTGFEIHICRSRSEAEQWVAERVRQKFGMTLAQGSSSGSPA